MDNIILIGMPGAGKSTVGVVLAKAIGYQFVDTDLIIQNRYKKILSQLIEQFGVKKFIEIEEDINSNLDFKNTVIATGGSVVYGKKAIEHLKSIGITVYLELSFKTICERLGNVKNRGVVLKQNQTLQQLYDERIPLYQMYSDITINCENKTIVDIIDNIVLSLNRNFIII